MPAHSQAASAVKRLDPIDVEQFRSTQPRRSGLDDFEGDDSGQSSSPRRQARVLALKALFEGDLVGHDPIAVVERLVEDESPRPSVGTYARRLVDGIIRDRIEIDREIVAAAPAWPLEQMPAIDKNLLRLAIYELLHDNDDVPAKAAINEAVEIAKSFGSESSSRFVNGVLGTIVAGQDNRASSGRRADLVETLSGVPPVADG